MIPVHWPPFLFSACCTCSSECRTLFGFLSAADSQTCPVTSSTLHFQGWVLRSAVCACWKCSCSCWRFPWAFHCPLLWCPSPLAGFCIAQDWYSAIWFENPSKLSLHRALSGFQPCIAQGTFTIPLALLYEFSFQEGAILAVGWFTFLTFAVSSSMLALKAPNSYFSFKCSTHSLLTF